MLAKSGKGDRSKDDGKNACAGLSNKGPKWVILATNGTNMESGNLKSGRSQKGTEI